MIDHVRSAQTGANLDPMYVGPHSVRGIIMKYQSVAPFHSNIFSSMTSMSGQDNILRK